MDYVFLLELLKSAATGAFLAVLGFCDYKSRSLPDKLVYSYLGFSAAAFTASLFLALEKYPHGLCITYVAFSALILPAFFYSTYKAGLVGDGDVFVSLSVGLSYAFPLSYATTIPRSGLLPPALVITLYSVLASLVAVLAQALVVFAKYKSLVRSLPGVYKVLVPLLAKPIKLGDYVEGRAKHFYPVQCFEKTSSGVVVKYRVGVRLNSGCSVELAEVAGLTREDYIWASPGQPLVFYMLLGFAAYVLLGDTPVLYLLTRLLGS